MHGLDPRIHAEHRQLTAMWQDGASRPLPCGNYQTLSSA
jgi:hypothetical protein